MKLFLTLVITCTSLLASQILVLATPRPVNTQPSSRATVAQNLGFVPPAVPDDPPPGGRVRGGARRDTCPQVKPALTALAPFTERPGSVTNVWGLTAQSHPTFWFYVPYSQNSGYPTEFVLQDEESNPIYQQAIALPEKPGVISVSLPANSAPLKAEKQYRWFFTVYCDPEKQAPPIYVEGVIKRVQLDRAISQQLETATPLQQVAIYAQNGVWYEALTILAQQLQKNPQDGKLQAQWQNLLASIRLDDIVKQPLLSAKPQ